MKIGAHYIVTKNGEVIKGGVLEINNQLIYNIIEIRNNIRELSQMEFHSGIICPNFTNIDFCSLNKSAIPSEIIQYFSTYNSNIKNSTFELMKFIQEKEPNLNITNLVSLFCELSNSSDISINSKADIVLISNINFEYFKLKKDSTIRNLI